MCLWVKAMQIAYKMENKDPVHSGARQWIIIIVLNHVVCLVYPRRPLINTIIKRFKPWNPSENCMKKWYHEFHQTGPKIRRYFLVLQNFRWYVEKLTPWLLEYTNFAIMVLRLKNTKNVTHDKLKDERPNVYKYYFKKIKTKKNQVNSATT